MTTNKKQTAIEQIQETADDLLVDKLDIADNSEEKKAEVLENITNQIDSLLKKLKSKEVTLKNFALNEKIELLQKTKLAVQELLVNILSGTIQNSPRAFEALASIIKVNAEIIRHMEETEGLIVNGKGYEEVSNEKNETTVVIAPTEQVLDSIMKMRHKNPQKSEKNVSLHVDE